MKTALLPFLLAPGLGIFLGIIAFVLLRKQKRRGIIVLACAIVFSWLMATEATGRFLGTLTISQIPEPHIQSSLQADMIVVLTSGSYYAGDIGWLPKTETYRRVTVAYELQNRIGSRIPVLISGGHTKGLQYPSEAKVAQSFFNRNHAQLTPTILEESSINTYESSLQCAALIQKREAKKVILVTSELHMLRAVASFRGRGIDVIPFPVLHLPRGDLGLSGWLPTSSGAHLTSLALYEIYGLVGYLLTGKITWDDIFYMKESNKKG